MLRAMAPRDTGKFPVSQSTTSSGMPFKEQQLKQLRAQCLVFLAFRYVVTSCIICLPFTISNRGVSGQNLHCALFFLKKRKKLFLFFSPLYNLWFLLAEMG